MDIKAITYCFEPFHFELLPKVLPSWCEQFGNDNIIVGYSERKADEHFLNAVSDLDVTLVPIRTRHYSRAYAKLLDCDFDGIVIFAPYVLPQQWLLGSLNQWLQDYALVGRFKPPRIMQAESLMLPLIAPVIVELGRLNLDFIAISSKAKCFFDIQYHHWKFGSILVRARPGAFALFNVLAAGFPVLTLPRNVKPVRYIIRKRHKDEVDKKKQGKGEMKR